MFSQDQQSVAVDKAALKKALAPFPCEIIEEIQAACELFKGLNSQSLPLCTDGEHVGELSPDGTMITRVPKSMGNNGHLARLFLLGKIKTIGGDFTLDGANIITFPQGQCVKGSFTIHDAPNLGILPSRTRVTGDMILLRCVDLFMIGGDIMIGGDLIISDCSNLPVLPCDLQISGDIIINDEVAQSINDANIILSKYLRDVP